MKRGNHPYPYPNPSSSSSLESRLSRNPGGMGPTSPPPPPPPAPLHGFGDLERRTIVLADGSVRSYFALPPDWRLPPPPVGRWAPPEVGDGERRARLRESVLLYGNPDFVDADASGAAPVNVADRPEGSAAKRTRREPENMGGNAAAAGTKNQESAFLELMKAINENAAERKKYLEDGKAGPLHCIVCGRSSKAFTGVHDLIMHTYTTQKADLRIDHLGLHKALCVLMGWEFARAPETSKAYQSLSAENAAANREDLIVWPPTVIVHNTSTGTRKDGRVDGLNNKDMESKLEELGFDGGTAKSLYLKGSHLGVTAVKFESTRSGLKEADRLVEYFEKANHGRKGWADVEASRTGDDEKNPALVEVDEKTGEKKRIFYGYLATAFDLEKVDIDTRKKAVIKSRRNLDTL